MKVQQSTSLQSANPLRVLVVGGGSDLQPRLRMMFPNIQTVALCRAAALSWIHQLDENQAVVVLNDKSGVDAWIAAARHINAEFPIDTLVSFAELDQDKAAAIGEALGLEFHRPEVVERVNNKVAMRARLRATGVESIPYRRLDSLDDALEFFSEVGPPLMFKPSRGRASTGVNVVRRLEEVAAAYHAAATATAPRVAASTPIAERYVEGPEFSVECITHNGHHYPFAVNEEFKDHESKVEFGHVIPARIDATTEELVVKHVQACLTALGITYGITHTEVIMSPEGPVCLETHLRLAGDEIPRMVHDATGVDMTDLLLRQAAGMDIGQLDVLRDRAERPRYIGAAAIKYLLPPAYGILDRIDGWDHVATIPGVRDHSQSVDEGSVMDGLKSSYSRLGYVRVRADNQVDALSLADKALGTLSVRYSDTP